MLDRLDLIVYGIWLFMKIWVFTFCRLTIYYIFNKIGWVAISYFLAKKVGSGQPQKFDHGQGSRSTGGKILAGAGVP